MRNFEKFLRIRKSSIFSNFVTNAFHLANFYSGIQQNAISESICHRGFWGWSLVETCMAVWMASFYWHRRAALIAEVRPEVHPIHPVQSTYGFWTFKPVYTYFRSIWASQLQSMAVWSLLNFCCYHYNSKNSFQKENHHYEIVAFLCYRWSNFLNFSWQDMHNSLFFLEKKSEIWNAFTFFENWKVNLVFLSLISRMKSEMKMP